MIKKIMLFLCFTILIVIQTGYAETKTFTDRTMGIEFKYPDNYNLEKINNNDFKQINLVAKDGASSIHVLKFVKSLNKKQNDAFMKAFIDNMLKKGFTIEENKKSSKELPIKRQFKAPSPKARIHRLILINQKQSIKLKIFVYLFNFGNSQKKGYITIFVQDGDKERKKDFKTVSKSFTVFD